jgi:L-rhamnose-H+ transport protein
VLAQVPGKTLGWIFLMGAVYGVANLTFGLSLRYLGLALGYALSLGLMMAIGTLVPPMIDGRFSQLFDGNAGVLLISGIVVSLIGIGISGYAGFLKSKQSKNTGDVNKEFNIWKGVASALFVGVTGSSAALGIEQGLPIATASVENGVNPLFQDSAVFLVLYSGSFLTTLIWCMYSIIKNKTMRSFVQSDGHSLWKNYLACACAGLFWFISFVFLGMGKSQMGELSFVAWGILMSMTIVFATVWGLYRKEWRGVSTKIYLLMWTGLIVLIAASFLIGLSAN